MAYDLIDSSAQGLQQAVSVPLSNYHVVCWIDPGASKPPRRLLGIEAVKQQWQCTHTETSSVPGLLAVVSFIYAVRGYTAGGGGAAADDDWLSAGERCVAGEAVPEARPLAAGVTTRCWCASAACCRLASCCAVLSASLFIFSTRD